MNFVAGFLFNPSCDKVALVKKNRPDWQKGRLNAIGGKIEAGELPQEAMHREFREETGAVVEDWDLFVILKSPSWSVHFYRSFGDPEICKTMTDEEILTIDTSELKNSPHISNLDWLIPLALNVNRGIKFPCVIEYD